MTTHAHRDRHAGRFFFALLVPLLALALAAPVLAQEPGADPTEEPEPGPGTEWMECREDAVESYDRCRIEAGQDFWDKYKCALAWDLDNIGCDVDLIEALIPGGNT